VHSPCLPRTCDRARRKGPRIQSHSTRKERALPQREGTPRLLTAGFTLIVSLFAAEVGHSQTALTLHSAIQQAESSALAHQGQDQVDAARGFARQAGLRPNPRLYIQSEDLRPWANNFDFANGTEDYGYLSQTFEVDGKRAKRVDLANANIRRSQAEQELLEQQIAGRVASAYWAAVASARIVKLLEDDLGAVDEMVRYHKERVDAGAMRGADLLRMQIERDRLMMSLEAARRDMTLTRIELFRQMDRPLDPQVQLTDPIDNLAPIQSQTIATVLASRADVASAREAVTVAQAEIKLQKALGVPDLDLLGGYKRNSGANTLYAGVQIPLPFSNRNQGEVQRAEANLHLAQDQLLQVEMSVRAEVTSAEEGYSRQREIVEHVLPDMRSSAQQNLTIMNDAYKTGGIDLLRYIDAERTAIDVEVSALRSLADFQQSTLRLTLAYGARP
jgi:cobalt-zinc-cadmium efflux system outer membrane protein